MRKTLQAITDGKFEYEKEYLLFSTERLEFLSNKDALIQGHFFIESSRKKDIKGILYTTDARMKCGKVQFAGKRIQIPFYFDTTGLDVSTTVKGDIYVESNIGEYNLPFVVSIVKAYPDSSLGKIKNMFHFANLAQKEYDEAYKLFVSKAFTQLEMNEQERMYHEMLSAAPVGRENMEEFLIAVQKKKEVTFSLDEAVQHEIYNGIPFSKKTEITRSGWGHLRIDVSAEGDFIRLERNVLTEDNFAGNRLEYEWYADTQQLHTGNNYGLLKFRSAHQEECVKITVHVPGEKDIVAQEINAIKVRLCKLYIQVRCRAIHKTSWVKESLLLVEKWLSLGGDNDFLSLFQAHLFILSKKKDEAKWILDRITENKMLKRQSPEVYAYMVYVWALYKQDEAITKQAVEEVRSLLNLHPYSYGILLILFFVDGELQGNALRKYQMLHEQYVYGCRSPFLYLESFFLIKSDLTLLNSFQEFEKQVLNFGVKHSLMTEEAAVFASKLAQNCKQFDKTVLRLMKKFYELYKKEETVDAICSLLIKNGDRSAESFEWYERGVLQNSKLNQLYEYYMATVPKDRHDFLPKPLLLYFSYNKNMDYRQKAYLYANVCEHKEEDIQLFEKYEPEIKQFVEEQLLQKHVNENLMYLYDYYMQSLMANEVCKEILEELIFTCRVQCEQMNMRRLIVKYPELETEDVFSITDGVAYAAIYTDDALLVFEDNVGKRHICTVEYKMKALLQKVKQNRYRIALDGKSTGLLLNGYKKSGIVMEKSSLYLCRQLMKKEEITNAFLQELLCRMIEYYEEKDLEEEICRLISQLDFNCMTQKERAVYIEKLILSGMYEDAYKLVFRYGVEEIRIKRLVRLCSRQITGGVDEDRLVSLCTYVFSKGKYDEVILEYLVSEFYGTTKEMLKVWEAACNFSIDSYKIGERVLVQMLFTGFLTGKASAVFEDYCSHTPNLEVVKAYVSFLSYHYVVNDRVVEPYVFTEMKKLWRQGEIMNDSCYLAFLKYYAEGHEMDKDTEEMIRILLQSLEEKRILFSFFEKVEKRINRESQIQEKEILEYRSNPKNKVMLHYRMIRPGEDTQDYNIEEMKQVLGPVFIKELTLFYGEILQYYVTEKEAGLPERVACSGCIEKQLEDVAEAEGRFGWLNELFVTKSMKDEVSLIEMMKKYALCGQITDEMFVLKE